MAYLKTKGMTILFAVLAILIATVFSIWKVKDTDSAMRQDILMQGKMIAASIDVRKALTLLGNESDLSNPDYIQLKQKFHEIKSSNPDCNFVYLLGRNEKNEIFFYLDNESPNSEGYSPPGEIYSEATREDLSVFDTKIAKAVGPAKDRWGTWITSLVPILNPDNGKLIAVVGMDFNADDWNYEILSRASMPIFLMLFVIALIGFVWNVNKARRLVEESERRHRLLFETSQEGIVVDQDFRLAYFNPKMLDITGYSSKELESISFISLVLDEDKEYFNNSYRCLLSGEIDRNRYQFRLIRKDKSIRWIELSSVRLTWKESPAALNFINDITEQKLAALELARLNSDLSVSKSKIEASLIEKNKLIEELSETQRNLEKANSEKDKFFSIIAHDLKNPFAAILGLSEIMAKDSSNLSRDEIDEFSKNIYDSADTLYKLLENLLEWSRMKRGITQFNPEDIDAHLTVDMNIKIICEFAKQKQIKLANKLPDGTNICADAQMLNTVLRNLISNAIKFTPRNGIIEVGGYEENNSNYFVLYVKDSGIGMDADLMKKLFKLDEKVSRPGTENESSTGLGLLLCKEFVEKHSGRIWVESVEGNGSTFFFTFPKKC